MGDFSKKLKQLRKNAGHTQAAAAALLKISPSAVGMYEQGRREPDFETVQRICDLYGVTPNYLVSDSDELARLEVGDLIAELRRRIKTAEGVTFDGAVLSDEDAEKVFDAMLLAAKLTLEHRSEKEQ